MPIRDPHPKQFTKAIVRQLALRGHGVFVLSSESGDELLIDSAHSILDRLLDILKHGEAPGATHFRQEEVRGIDFDQTRVRQLREEFYVKRGRLSVLNGQAEFVDYEAWAAVLRQFDEPNSGIADDPMRLLHNLQHFVDAGACAEDDARRALKGLVRSGFLAYDIVDGDRWYRLTDWGVAHAGKSADELRAVDSDD